MNQKTNTGIAPMLSFIAMMSVVMSLLACGGALAPTKAHGEECSSDDECLVRCECGVCSNGNEQCGDRGDGECAAGFSCRSIYSDDTYCVKSCSSNADCPGEMTCDTVINQCTTRSCD